MTSKTCMPSLTDSNRAILLWIGQGGLATREQLTRRFWPEGGPRCAYLHLYRLVSAGYLMTQIWQGPLGRTPLYALTAQGGRALGMALPAIQVGWPGRREYNHMIMGQEMRLLLEQRLAGQGGRLLAWRTERLLRHLHPPSTTQEEIPDARADIQASPDDAVQIVDIEIDGQYYGQMLARKAAQYGAHHRRVLWACLPGRAALVAAAVAPYPNIELCPLTPYARAEKGPANG